MGQRGVLGIRVQPNHPADDLGGILLAAVDGLLFGCGDAVIGVNPATESVETVGAILHGLDRLIDSVRRTDAGVLPGPHHHAARLPGARRPVDLLFQSVAGTQAANASFGVTLALLREGRERVLEDHRRRDGRLGRRQRDVLRDGPGQRPVGRRAPRRRSADAGGAGLRRGAGVRPVPGQQRRRLHRPGVPVRRAADHPRRPGRPLHGQAARPADGRATSATPTTPPPTRTRPTTCCCCWRPPAATTSWACPVPTT